MCGVVLFSPVPSTRFWSLLVIVYCLVFKFPVCRRYRFVHLYLLFLLQLLSLSRFSATVSWLSAGLYFSWLFRFSAVSNTGAEGVSEWIFQRLGRCTWVSACLPRTLLPETLCQLLHGTRRSFVLGLLLWAETTPISFCTWENFVPFLNTFLCKKSICTSLWSSPSSSPS